LISHTHEPVIIFASTSHDLPKMQLYMRLSNFPS